MMKKQENTFFYKPDKKTGIIHILVSMAAGLFITATAFAADFTVSTPVTTFQTLFDNQTGRITAPGSITITEPGGNAAYPITISGTANINLLNQGNIFATGINLVKGIRITSSTLTNSLMENANTLSVTTTGANLGMVSFDYIESVGIGGWIALVNLDNTRIKNSGTLLAEGTRSVLGIYTGNLTNSASITNTGTLSINQTAAAWNGGPVYGIRTGNLDNSSVLNAGTIFVNSIFGGTGIFSGITSSNASINNSGQIKLNGTHGTGLYVLALGNGTSVKNTGSISVTQTGGGATSYGIRVAKTQSGAFAITNTGNITLVTNDPSSTAYGMYSGAAAFDNSGTITALDSSGAMGANMYSVKTRGALTNGGILKGVLEAGDTTNSGRIAMPAATSKITGNFTQTGSGRLGITLSSDDNPANTKYSKLTVSGTTTLAPGSGIDVDMTTASASFQETGAGGMNLNVDSIDAHSLVAALEGDVVWSFAKGIDLTASASLGYDVINEDIFVGSRFQGGGAVFQTKGLENSPFVYGAGLGLGKKISDLFSIEAKYDLEGRGYDLMSHMVSARLNWKFYIKKDNITC